MPIRFEAKSPYGRFLLPVLALSLMAGAGQGQVADATLDALLDSREIPVNVDNFVRAATNIEFGKYAALAGGVNRFFHFREPVQIDKQPTIRMNRDTLYSAVVVDISEGATLSLPDVGDRYMTAMVVNQDHFINEVFFGGGTYPLDMKTFDTPYVIVFLRMLVDAADPEDVADVNAIQDAMVIKAASSKPFIVPNYNEAMFEAMVSAILGLAQFTPDSARMFGHREEVDGVRHFLGTAGGWGGLPESEAFYLNVEPGLPVSEYKIEVPADVPVDAFWSISLYNASGFFEANALDVYNVNSVTGDRKQDGSMTVYFGGCDDGRENCLPLVEGWNYTVRMYRPEPPVLDGSWTFPTVQSVN